MIAFTISRNLLPIAFESISFLLMLLIIGLFVYEDFLACLDLKSLLIISHRAIKVNGFNFIMTKCVLSWPCHHHERSYPCLSFSILTLWRSVNHQTRCWHNLSVVMVTRSTIWIILFFGKQVMVIKCTVEFTCYTVILLLLWITLKNVAGWILRSTDIFRLSCWLLLRCDLNQKLLLHSWMMHCLKKQNQRSLDTENCAESHTF